MRLPYCTWCDSFTHDWRTCPGNPRSSEGRANWAEHARIAGACLAMSRFLVWVWCEARWQEIAHDRYCPLSVADPVVEAIQSGLLHLDWSWR